MLKIDTKGERLPVVPFADTDAVQVGDLVLAIGDPFGVGQTVTMGIVSALARTQVTASDYQFFIQTDAAINPGNSGGALVTTDGKLAGINTAIYSRSGGSIGIGFAIPANLARRVVEGVEGGLKSGAPASVQLAWVGASGQPVTSEIAASLGLPRPGGVLIKDVYPGGPLARAGIKSGDVVQSGGRRRGRRHAIAELPHRHPSARRQREDACRGRQVGARRHGDPGLAAGKSAPRNHHHRRPQSLTGARVLNVSPAAATELQMDVMAKGVAIASVNSSGIAANYGFQPGDIVRSINGVNINRAERTGARAERQQPVGHGDRAGR